MNSYDLSRNFWNWAFDNPEKISPNHAAIYFFSIEHCNRLGWKKKFGFPSQMTMDAIGIKKHSTYIRYFNDLVEYGFFNLIQKSSNQYSSNIISLSIALPKKGEALDKAMLNHEEKQSESIGKSKRSIDKQLNKEQENNITIKQRFESFWLKYPKKIGKKTALSKWLKLSESDIDKIESTIDSFIKYKPFKDYTHPNPCTYLNQERWNDEIEKPKNNTPFNHIKKETPYVR